MNKDIYICEEKIKFQYNSDQFDLIIKEIEIETDDGINSIKLLINVNQENYNYIDKNYIFHLTPEVRKDSALDSFDSNKPIELDLKYSIENIRNLDQEITKGSEILNRIKNKDKELVNPDNWYALNVKQEIDLPPGEEGSLKMGYATTWADKKVESILNEDPFLNEVFLFFNANVPNCSIYNNQPEIHFSFAHEEFYLNSSISVRSKFKQVILYTYCPFEIPKEFSDTLTKLIHDINWGLPTGNFELNTNTKELRYKTYVDFSENEFNTSQLKLLFQSNVYTIIKYLKEIKEKINI